VTGRDEHAVLVAHVVAEPDHVHAHAHERLGRGEMVVVGNVENGVRKIGVLYEVGQQLLEPA